MPVSMGIVSEVGSVLEYYASTLDITIGVPTQVGKCQHGYNHMPDNSHLQQHQKGAQKSMGNISLHVLKTPSRCDITHSIPCG